MYLKWKEIKLYKYINQIFFTNESNTCIYKSPYYKLDNAQDMKKFDTEISVMPKNTSSHYFT